MYCAHSCLVCILAYLQRDTGCWTLECSCRRSLPAQGGSHSAFLHLGSVAISNFRLDRCDQVWSATSGLTAPWLLTALRKIDWKTNYSEIKHDWTCRFQLLERDDQYDWQLWLHWCLGWKLLHDGIICYNQPATSPSAFGRAQIRSSYIKSVCLHFFVTRLVYCKKWSDMENIIVVWLVYVCLKLFEVFHCKLRFLEHYGEFVLGGRSLLVFAGNRCEWMASAKNHCSSYSFTRFLATGASGFKSCRWDRTWNILMEVNLIRQLYFNFHVVFFLKHVYHYESMYLE